MKKGFFRVIGAFAFAGFAIAALPRVTFADSYVPNQDPGLVRARDRSYADLAKSIKQATRNFNRKNALLLASARSHKKTFCRGSFIDMNQDGYINIQDLAFSISLIQGCAKFGASFSGVACKIFDLDGDGVITMADSDLAWRLADTYTAEYCSVPAANPTPTPTSTPGTP